MKINNRCMTRICKYIRKSIIVLRRAIFFIPYFILQLLLWHIMRMKSYSVIVDVSRKYSLLKTGYMADLSMGTFYITGPNVGLKRLIVDMLYF